MQAKQLDAPGAFKLPFVTMRNLLGLSRERERVKDFNENLSNHLKVHDFCSKHFIL